MAGTAPQQGDSNSVLYEYFAKPVHVLAAVLLGKLAQQSLCTSSMTYLQLMILVLGFSAGSNVACQIVLAPG